MKSFKEFIGTSSNLNEGKMYVSEYLSESDVENIIKAINANVRKFHSDVKTSLEVALKGILPDVIDSQTPVTINKLNINGFLFADSQISVWVKDMEYVYITEDKDTKTIRAKNEKYWITL